MTADDHKVPHNPGTGLRASPTDPADWGGFFWAIDAANRRGHRLGFVLTSRDPFVLIDLDKCRDPLTGALEPWATDIVRRFPTAYIEVSMSGTGLHIIGQTDHPLPAGRRRTGRIEIYDDGRYVVMTGDNLFGHETPGDITTAVDDFYRETFPPAPPRQPQPVTGPCPGSTSLEDDELIERARSARNGAKFDRLWGGELSDSAGDESAADLALLSLLAFWTSDEDQLDRLFRLSGLYREKWERLDYRSRTIARALERSETYNPPGPRPTVRPNTQDASFAPEAPATADDLPDDIASLKMIIIDLRGQVDDERSARLAAEARADRSARLQSRTADILRNPHLGQERVVAVALSHEFAHRESAGDTGTDGLYRVPLARVAERTGVSKETASRGIKRLEALGTLSRRIVMVPELSLIHI